MRRFRGRVRMDVAVVVPVAVLVVAVATGVAVAATRREPTAHSATSTVPAPDSTSVARGSGRLNDVLVRSIVQIVLMEDGVDCAVGSGSVIGDSLHVVTNHHVIEDDKDCRAERISVRTSTSASATAVETYVGDVIASSENDDVAILALTPTGKNSPILEPLKIGLTDEIGQEITVVGYPAIGGDSATVSRGILSGFADVDGLQWIKTDALISGGNSGGAALDAAGRLLGIPTMYSQSTSGDIVDCRNAADTNGDGTIDGRDQCVTTGGTIGLIAPAPAFVKLARSAGLKVTVES